MNRPMHRVSVKIAFINKLGDKVLMTQLHDGGYGLPGGHIEIGETPETALDRELREELGLADVEYAASLKRIDFWRDLRTDRILLGYSALLDEGAKLTLNYEEMKGVYWASLGDFDRGDVATVTYEKFIRKVLDKK